MRRGRIDDGGGDAEAGEKLYYHLTLLAENGARATRTCSSCRQRRLPRGLFLQSAGSTGSCSSATTKGSSPPPAAWAAWCSRRCSRGHRAGRRAGGPAAGHLRAGVAVRRAAGPRPRRAAPDQPRADPPGPARSARRCWPPTTATTCRAHDAEAHDALLCVQTGSVKDDPKRFKFHGDEHYLKTAAEMRQLFRDYPEACDNTLWIAERADVEIEFGKPKLPSFPRPDGFADADAYLRHLTYEGAAATLRGSRCPAEVARAARLRARGHLRHGVLGLLPRRLGPDPPRPRPGDPGRPGPGERGRLLRGLLPADRRPRPDPLPAAVRAVPQPGPQADARHRHGLRRALPRRDDPLRRRAVRLGPGGPDRHLLDHQGPGGGPRRGPGPRLPVQPRATGSPRPCRRW